MRERVQNRDELLPVHSARLVRAEELFAFTSAQSPIANALSASATPRILRCASTEMARRFGFWCEPDSFVCIRRVRGFAARPVLHTHTPKGRTDFFFVFLSITTALPRSTLRTLRPVRTEMPSRANFSAAYLEMRSS
jgi:hypothetical protein